MIPADETFDGTWPYTPRFCEAAGFRQHYIDEGAGRQADPRRAGAAQAQGNQAPKGGNATQDMGPRTNIAGGAG